MSNNNAFFSDNFQNINRAFLYGDAVKVSFFVRKSQLIMAEESYFFLMSSMRKMRMKIPLSYTLDFFTELFEKEVLGRNISDGFIHFMAFRNRDENLLSKAETAYYFEFFPTEDVLKIQRTIEMDLIKEISVNNNLLSNIKVHSPENIYAEVYATENDLDDLILLNPNKRIARSIYGNLLFLNANYIKIPKQSEGSYISPLTENLITFIHRNNFAEIEPAEIAAFESQKAEEILLVSDEKGIFSVGKIRNKTFENSRFREIIGLWQNNFD